MPRRDTNPLDPGPASDAFAITPGNAFPAGYTAARSIYVGVGGTVVLTTLQGNQVSFVGVPAGMTLSIGCTAVDVTSTAGSILGLI